MAVTHQSVNQPRYPAVVGFVAFLTILVSAWGGIAPFIGPTFGYSGAGGRAWHWSLAHAALAVVPAAAGIVGAMLVLGAAGSWRIRGTRGGVGLGGIFVLLAGGWFAVGWIAWQPLGGASYISSSTTFGFFVNVVGLAIGPGLVLAAFGAMTLGFLAYASSAGISTDTTFAGSPMPGSPPPDAGDYQSARSAAPANRPPDASRESAAG